MVSGDQTEILSKGYWPSYNVPFYEEVSSIFIVDCVFKSWVLSISQKNSSLHFRQFPVTNEMAFPEFPEEKTTTQSIPNFLPGILVPFDFHFRIKTNENYNKQRFALLLTAFDFPPGISRIFG